MSYLRFATRHLQRTCGDLVADHMKVLGWTGEMGPVPLGTSPATVLQRRLREDRKESLTGNLISISFADEPDEDPQEMGGGLVMVEHVMFVDCVGVEEPHALSMASDVKDLLTGKAPGTSRYASVRDYSSIATGMPAPGHQIEFVDVIRDKPDGNDWRAKWHVVKATIEYIYPGSE